MLNKKFGIRIFLAFLFLFTIHILYNIPAPFKWLEAKWTAGDLITFTGTMMLGIVALLQNENANEMNKRIVDSEYKRNYRSDIIPLSVTFTPSDSTTFSALQLCLDENCENETSQYDMSIHFHVQSKENRDSIEAVRVEDFVLQHPKTLVAAAIQSPSEWVNCRAENDYYPVMPTIITKNNTLFKLNASISLPVEKDNTDITDAMLFRMILILSYKNIYNVVCETRLSVYFERAYNGLMEDKYYVVDEEKPLAIHMNKIYVDD